MNADVAAADAARRLARSRAIGTADELQRRLSPDHLASETVDGIKHGTAAIARAGVDAARKRPALAIAASTAIGLFLARQPIGALFRRHDATRD